VLLGHVEEIGYRARSISRLARAVQRRSAMNVAVIFYSAHGNTWTLAAAIAEGAERAGATVRLCRVPEVLPTESTGAGAQTQAADPQYTRLRLATNDDLLWADGVAFGSPTRYGNMCSQLKYFLDQTGSLWLSGALVGKVAGVFCSTSTMHGGQESTLISMMLPLFHLGFLVQGLPYAEAEQMSMDDIHGGSPYGVSSVSGARSDRAPTEIDRTLARALGRRLAMVAGKLRAGG
jgi:NAD(P)H dehydrogenase (quinone)